MIQKKKKPLYRKVNTKTHGVKHDHGSDYRMIRKKKNAKHVSMYKDKKRGLDYTPLYMFLISKVGSDWDDVYSEAISRLDSEAPIYHIVKQCLDQESAIVRCGQSSFYSGMYIDDNGKLQLIDASIDEHSFPPGCSCCTHTFNGKPLTQPYS